MVTPTIAIALVRCESRVVSASSALTAAETLAAEGIEARVVNMSTINPLDEAAIVDAAGTEVARITKRWEGLARTLFTTADKYVVHVHFKLPEPLASMVIASALTVDTALKQDDRGF